MLGENRSSTGRMPTDFGGYCALLGAVRSARCHGRPAASWRLALASEASCWSDAGPAVATARSPFVSDRHLSWPDARHVVSRRRSQATRGSACRCEYLDERCRSTCESGRLPEHAIPTSNLPISLTSWHWQRTWPQHAPVVRVEPRSRTAGAALLPEPVASRAQASAGWSSAASSSGDITQSARRVLCSLLLLRWRGLGGDAAFNGSLRTFCLSFSAAFSA